MTSHLDMGDAFIVKTSLAVLKYARTAFRGALERYDRIVFPCAGRFGMVEAAVDAGWRTHEVRATDINIMSAVIGYMAGGMDMDGLQITFTGDSKEAEWARAKFAAGNHAAAVFMMLKFAQFASVSTLKRLVRDELWHGRDDYGNQFQAKVARLAEKLRDLDFDVEDVFKTAAEYVEDERSLIVVDPWRSYDSVFSCVGETGNASALITWNAPIIEAFNPKIGMESLHNLLMPGNALVLFHGERKLSDQYRQRAVFAVERGPSFECMYCNRPQEAQKLVQKKTETEVEAAPIPVLNNDYEITDASKVQVVPCDKVQACYYSDLWGFLLRQSAYAFFVMVDGQIAGLVGLSFRDIRQSKGPWVKQVYAAVPTYARPYLLDLCMMAMVSRQAQELFESIAGAPLYSVSEYRVFQFSEDAVWAPADSACLRAASAKRQKDGSYLLDYRGEFGTFDLSTVAKAWKEFVFKHESLHDAAVSEG